MILWVINLRCTNNLNKGESHGWYNNWTRIVFIARMLEQIQILVAASNEAGASTSNSIPSGADWVKVYNYTKAGANGLNQLYFQGTANAYAGVEFYWQRGMAAGTGIVKYKANGAATLDEDTLVSGGFTVYDPINNQLGTLNSTMTAISSASIPVVTNTGSNLLAPGDVVRLIMLLVANN